VRFAHTRPGRRSTPTLELMNCPLIFLAGVVLSLSFKGYAAEAPGTRLVDATVALSRADLTDGVTAVEQTIGSSLREVQASDVVDASDVPAQLLQYGRVFKPVHGGSGIQWLTTGRSHSPRYVGSIRPDATTCVSPLLLEEALNSKAEFSPDVPMHGGPLPTSPGAFLPGTRWVIRVVHAQSLLEIPFH
jgi:hypothetical protein